jgi:chromosome segregation ATPase
MTTFFETIGHVNNAAVLGYVQGDDDLHHAVLRIINNGNNAVRAQMKLQNQLNELDLRCAELIQQQFDNTVSATEYQRRNALLEAEREKLAKDQDVNNNTISEMKHVIIGLQSAMEDKHISIEERDQRIRRLVLEKEVSDNMVREQNDHIVALQLALAEQKNENARLENENGRLGNALNNVSAADNVKKGICKVLCKNLGEADTENQQLTKQKRRMKFGMIAGFVTTGLSVAALVCEKFFL